MILSGKKQRSATISNMATTADKVDLTQPMFAPLVTLILCVQIKDIEAEMASKSLLSQFILFYCLKKAGI